MSSVSRGVIYSLLAVVLVLLLGIMALLGVSYNRHQRLEDATADLKRNLSQQESKIADLQERLEGCDTVQTVIPPVSPIDTSWNSPPTTAPEKVQNPPPKW